jgi:hypothetical protein
VPITTPCTPTCGSSICGSNGCGGSCGTCGVCETCQGGSCGEAPDTTPCEGGFCLGGTCILCGSSGEACCADGSCEFSLECCFSGFCAPLGDCPPFP